MINFKALIRHNAISGMISIALVSCELFTLKALALPTRSTQITGNGVNERPSQQNPEAVNIEILREEAERAKIKLETQRRIDETSYEEMLEDAKNRVSTPVQATDNRNTEGNTTTNSNFEEIMSDMKEHNRRMQEGNEEVMKDYIDSAAPYW